MKNFGARIAHGMLIEESLEKPVVFWGPLAAHNTFSAEVAVTHRKNKFSVTAKHSSFYPLSIKKIVIRNAIVIQGEN